MAVIKEQPGAGAFYGTAAKQIGQSLKTARQSELARQEEQQQQQMALQIMSMKQREDLARFQAQLNLEREKRARAWQVETEERAKAWELEKMETVSRLDFERKERQRQQALEEYNTKEKVIMDSPLLEGMDDKKEDIKLKLKLDAIGVSPTLFPELFPELEKRKQSMFDFSEGGEVTSFPETGTGQPSPENPLGLNIVNVPTAQLSKEVMSLEAQNKFEVISPDGKKETINASQWPEYKTKGYLLAAIVRQREQVEERRKTQETVSKVLAGGYGGI